MGAFIKQEQGFGLKWGLITLTYSGEKGIKLHYIFTMPGRTKG